MELKTEHITKNFNNRNAVNDCSLTMSSGIYGLLGPNGSGKTTLIRILASLLKPDSGEIFLNGEKVDMLDDEYRGKLGYLPQHTGFYPNYSGFDFLLYLAALKGIPKMTAMDQAKRVLNLTGLSEVSKRKIRTYSGGMKQRLAIAQSLLGDPEILLLDEPTASLDPAERIRFRNIVSSLSKEKIILISTHIVSDLECLADYILIMKNGQIIHNAAETCLLSMIEGKVYSGEVTPIESGKLASLYPCVSMRTNKDSIRMRLISDTAPSPAFKPCEASLEDLYLYLFQEERGGSK